jgi:hypothetical protein
VRLLGQTCFPRASSSVYRHGFRTSRLTWRHSLHSASNAPVVLVGATRRCLDYWMNSNRISMTSVANAKQI